MKYINLGKTGIKVSEVGFGGIPIIRLQTDEAIKVLRHAHERGITFYDTANMYRNSEAKIGQAFSMLRDKVIIATKTMRRDAKGFARHLEKSLGDLKTSYIDIYQFHQVANKEEWEKLCRPDGALAAAQKAKEEGKIRFLGLISHNLSVAIDIIKTGFFDTIQFPFNFIEEDFKNEFYKYALNNGVGMIAMKPFAGGVIDNAGLAFKYLRQFPEVIPIPGFDSIQVIDEVVSLYEHTNEITKEDNQSMERYRRELGKKFCRRCEYCQPCPEGVMITPAMGYPIVAKRMSPAVSVEFLKIPMESTLKCTQCGTCIERCPYNLPIFEILKKNYILFESHLAHSV
ncbi:MAG TPA: aldo/keto reductase [Deltaproteobacteria bacterium]|nr:aldo/keto reductase [Deltaproteobacteria bacterium]